MEGAVALDVSHLKAKKLLNLDSENEGIMLVSCAGGCSTVCELPAEWEKSAGNLVSIHVAGLKGAFTGINIKLMKCTGMREAWKMVTLARALDMKVMVGCMTETSCAITAASQFSPAVDFADLDGSLLIANDRFKGMEVVKGKITLPDLPGIGVVKL